MDSTLPPIPPSTNPDGPKIALTADQLQKIGDAAGAIWPSIKTYWPLITAVLIGFGVVTVATTTVVNPPTTIVKHEEPAPVVVPPPVMPPIDFAPVIKSLDGVRSDIKLLDTNDEARHKDVLDAINANRPKPPVNPPVDPPQTDAILFVGPTKANIGTPVDVQAKLAAGVTSLALWASPGQTAYVKIVGDTAIIVAKDSSDIWVEACCLDAKGKLVGPVQWKVTAGNGPQPPPVVPPTPTDPYQAAIQSAWERDGKPALVSTLASVYKLAQTSTVTDKTLTTPEALRVRMHAAIQAALNEPDPVKVTVLSNVRAAIATDFNASVGLKTQDVLTDANRAAIAAEFLKTQRALEGVR